MLFLSAFYTDNLIKWIHRSSTGFFFLIYIYIYTNDLVITLIPPDSWPLTWFFSGLPIYTLDLWGPMMSSAALGHNHLKMPVVKYLVCIFQLHVRQLSRFNIVLFKFKHNCRELFGWNHFCFHTDCPPAESDNTSVILRKKCNFNSYSRLNSASLRLSNQRPH